MEFEKIEEMNQCVSCDKEMNKDWVNSMCKECEKDRNWDRHCFEYEKREMEDLALLTKNAVGNAQDNLVEFLLYDDKIRGIDNIDWNGYGLVNDDDEYVDDKEYMGVRDEALNICSWYCLNDCYKDSFDNNNHHIPIYKFKGEVWILNINNFMLKHE